MNQQRRLMACLFYLTEILVAAVPLQAASAGELDAQPVQRPQFKTEIVALEDTILFGTPAEGSLIYRTEGSGRVERNTQQGMRGLVVQGPVGYIHPAQYGRAALRLRLVVLQGEPGIAIAHNGMSDRAGNPNPSPGVEVALREQDTAVRDLTDGRLLETLPTVFPRGTEAELTVAWDSEERWLRIDLPETSYQMALPASATRRGGFALRAPTEPVTVYRATRIQVLWQDHRDLVLYDGQSTLLDLEGNRIGEVPAIQLPEGMTNYSTCAVDLQRERSLIVFGGPDLNAEHPETIKGFAVRDLRTGKLDLLGPRVNDCLPLQGGGGIDGYWLMQSWVPPASTYWLDWNAYDRGDRAGFVVPAMPAVHGENGAFVGFHDTGNALDGSLARYLRITESWRGVNHLTVHPNLVPYAPFEEVAFPPPEHPRASHTGSAGMPTQLALRDRDRAWYEVWSFLDQGHHLQYRGYNLFTRQDDWQGPFHPPGSRAAYSALVNMAPDLVRPGYLIAPRARFNFAPDGSVEIVAEALLWLHAEDGYLVVEHPVKLTGPWPMPFQTLVDLSAYRLPGGT